MLKLRRLDVSGFKSFVDPTDLEFSDGVTAIVGPNGCGKSNVADAITWALGEQSAKSLRGETMEDVIFNGTDGRRPLGLAEVTLTLDTDPGAPGSENGQMALSRRVFRTGESQYRLNGKVVRLKDFRDLLMDTGLGLRAYSVIEQGRIGMILSGKPQERRRLLEEAAGVTRYKSRQRVAEVKLEEAQSNLLRLNDIIAEIERTLRSLKRQAGAAKRLQEKRAEARRLLHLVLSRRHRTVGDELAALGAAIDESVAADAELGATISRDEARLAQARGALDALSEDLAQRHRRQAERGAFIEGRQHLSKEQRQTLAETRVQMEVGAAAAERRREEREEVEAALALAEERRAAARAEHDDSAAAAAEDDARLAAAETEAARAESALEALREQLLSSLGEVTNLRNQLHREQIEAEKGSYQRQRLGEQLTLWTSQVAEAAGILSSCRAATAAVAADLAAQELELEAAATALASSEGQLRAAQERERGLAARLDGARQRQGVLAELSAAHSERRHAWRDALSAAGLTEPAFLGDGARPAAGWERSLDLYLGGIADAAVVEGERRALELASALAASGASGRIALRAAPAEPAEPAESPEPMEPMARDASEPLQDPAIVAPLAEALGIEEDLRGALPPAYLVATAADAQRLARRHPGTAFITPDRLWAQGGILHIQGDAAQPGLLERRRESRELTAEIAAIEADAVSAAARSRALTVEAQTAADRLAQARAATSGRREELAAARARLAELEMRHQRLSVEHTTLDTERAEVERELERVGQRERQLLADLERSTSRHRELEADFDAAQSLLADARAAREVARAAVASRRGRLALLAERLTAHDEESARLARRGADLVGQSDAWREEYRRLASRRDELEAAIRGAESALQTALEETAAAQGGLGTGQQAVEERRAELRRLEEEIQGRRLRRDDGRAALAERRVRQATLRQETEHLEATYLEEFRQPLPEQGGEDSKEPGADLAALEADLARCKQAIEQLGPVNVLAGEEYTEQEERHTFLTVQRADVVRSIDSLKATIREINATSSERFAAAFRAVNEHFGRTFAELFRGGEAEMRLLDEDDLMESGIEIVARPPGKRLQNLMLLSGGEKALTAIALLFALFRAKPSPFCILDEVDAPLDDINTLRFVDLLGQMARETQFIVITHNKLTMEVAARLYGVTMEERGVSKLVSVALDDVQPSAAVAATA